ncbi:response regulator [candidate division KSB1 bacterium]|nr:response regulator [candidate division KSB1 bacterium]
MKRLLVIEDDLNTRSGLIELLQDEGYVVLGARFGFEALKLISTEAIDMVLCDYSLPDLDGLQVCQEVKKHRPEILLFLITGFCNSKMINTAQECGVERIFTKPLMLDDLFQMLLCYSKNQCTSRKESQPVSA